MTTTTMMEFARIRELLWTCQVTVQCLLIIVHICLRADADQQSPAALTDKDAAELDVSRAIQMMSSQLGIPVGKEGVNLTDSEVLTLHQYLREHALIPPTSTYEELDPEFATNSGTESEPQSPDPEPGPGETEIHPGFSGPHKFGLVDKIRQLIGGQKSGFFVEARARDGTNFNSFSRTVLERVLGWSGLLVEPVPELLRVLEAQERRAWIARACLSQNSTEYMEYFWMNNSGESGYNPRHPLKLLPPRKLELLRKLEGLPNRIIECFPLKHILGAIGVKEIDLLILDLQDGNEYKVLNYIPATIPVKIIVVQHRLVPEGRNAFKGLMYHRRYYLTFESDTHHVFVQQKIVLGSILKDPPPKLGNDTQSL